MKDKILIDLHFLGSIAYYQKLLEYQEVIFEAQENFVRASYRNRCEICGPNGKSILTVQVKGARKKKLYKDIEITFDHNWNKIHWETLCSNYRRSPYFEYYEDHFYDLFHQPSTHIMTLNRKLFETVNKLLGLDIKYSYTEIFQKETPPEIDDFRGYFMPNKKVENVIFKPYIQVFASKNGFFPNLSILDLLFCEGPNAISYLKP